MKGRELDRALALADELVELRASLRRIRHLEEEIAAAGEVERHAPDVVHAASRRRDEIEQIARELEDQWVMQNPLVTIWQRAVDLAEQAAYAGADTAPYQDDVDEARHRVEAARLETREVLDRLAGEREALVDVALAAPFELPLCEAVHDDGRPEAARRDALALAGYAQELDEAATRAHAVAARTVADARAELAELGDPVDVQSRIDAIERELPAVVPLPGSAPPSAAIRLERAGIAVEQPR